MNYINQLIICALISLSSFGYAAQFLSQPQQQNPNAAFGALAGALGNMAQQRQQNQGQPGDTSNKLAQAATIANAGLNVLSAMKQPQPQVQQGQQYAQGQQFMQPQQGTQYMQGQQYMQPQQGQQYMQQPGQPQYMQSQPNAYGSTGYPQGQMVYR